MKKTKKILIVLSALFALQSKAQWYGQISYPHDSTILSSAKRVPNRGGYVIAGFRQVRASTSNFPDFVIDKVNAAGDFTGINNFAGNYQIQDDPTCGNAVVNQYNCNGLTVIEVNPAGQIGQVAYALAGAYQKGVFFATLNAAGNIITRRSWNFPGMYLANPVIRESVTNPGQFYICATALGASYVMKVNSAGTQLWGKQLTANGAGVAMQVRDVIEAPSTYYTNQIVVVGRTDVMPVNPTAADAFFLRLNSTNGNYVDGKTYNLAIIGSGGPMIGSDDWFSSIEIAKSTAGGVAGYILGGRALSGNATVYNGEYMQWMCKLQKNGSIVWSTLIKPNGRRLGFYQAGTEINRALERFNSGTNKYEYYGVAQSNYMPGGGTTTQENLAVFKLNDLGKTNGLSPTEFHYSRAIAPRPPAGGLYSYSDLSLIATVGGSANDGIQAFGTWPVPYQNHFFAKAYFNGKSGCKDTVVNIDSIKVGPQVQINLWAPNLANITQCNKIQIIRTAGPGAYTTLCYAPTVSGGSNARPALGVTPQAFNQSGFSLYPNPVSHSATLAIPEDVRGKLQVTIHDALGREVQHYEVDAELNREFSIDFEALHIKDGFYTLLVKTTDTESSYKIIYNAK